MSKDPQGKKWLGVINSPATLDHEKIKSELNKLKSVVYWCMSDEIGNDEQTPHTHVYLACSSPVRFSTLKNLFPKAHLERANGSHQQNRSYIEKSGKWADTDKAKTSIPGTFEEGGEIPLEPNRDNKNSRGLEAYIVERILDGATNAEILLEFPALLRGLRDVEHVRQVLRNEEYRDKWRDLEVIYMWGDTGVGKTRSVMDKYGYRQVYAVNNYTHPFDLYAGENVMLFDEFFDGFRIQDMNNYLDGYPLPLPARYNNKQACYERVFIISNLDLWEQYQRERIHQRTVWEAFIRRIHKVIKFLPDGTQVEYETQEYLKSTRHMDEVDDESTLPPDSNVEDGDTG